MPLPDRISGMGDSRSFPGKEGEQSSEKNEEGQKQSLSGRISAIFAISYAGWERWRKWASSPAQIPFGPGTIYGVFNVGGHAACSICSRLALMTRFGFVFNDYFND